MCRTKRNLGLDEAANWPRRRSSAAEGRRSALFEGDDGAEALAVSRVLDEMDIDTMWCPGPGSGGHAPRCPLVTEGHCELIEKADFVINHLGTHDAGRAAVARAVDETPLGDKVAVVAGWQQADSCRAELRRCAVVDGPLTRRIVEDIAQAG